jgi:hyaluronan synthase
LLQFVLASLNNYLVPKKTKALQDSEDSEQHTSNILVVGYKEDPDYYSACLKSVKQCFLTNHHVNKVIVVIDGDDETDQYMVDIFQSVFDGAHLALSGSLQTIESLSSVLHTVHNNKFVCITQSHSSKRHAMHTGFLLSILENTVYHTSTQTVLCTDSDTILDPHCIDNMLPLFNDIDIGAVAGNLAIYTKYDSVISFLSSLRYWFAFNLERSYQSFNKYVVCVSGPIGMYRISSLEKVIDQWINQTFLSKPCTYGDDRHLTNQILSIGQRVLYSPNAHASTETPSDLTRFYRQQTRWSKSSYREFIWSLRSIFKQHPLMSVDLLYALFFPYLVMAYMLYVLWFGNFQQLQLYVIVLAASGLVKTTYGVISSKNPEILFYFLYILPYICVVFPSKIWALLTITDTSWGTSFRNSRSLVSFFSFDLIFLFLWNCMLTSSVCYSVFRFVSVNVSLSQVLPLVSLSGLFVFSVFLMILYVLFQRQAPENHSPPLP